MSASLISAMLMSLLMHAALVLFGPGFRPPLIDEPVENQVEVEMVRREVPIPEALRPKPLPEVSTPRPLDLSRLLKSQGGLLGPARPALKADPAVPAPRKIPKSRSIGGPPELDLPRPATSLEQVALPRQTPGAPPELALPVGKPGPGKGLGKRKAPVRKPDPAEVRNFEEEIARLVREDREKSRRQTIRGPAAARRVVFRPPAPQVKIAESSGDIELRFWVLPDGTVGRVIPVRKGNAYLEGVAANHMKRWRFSPLAQNESLREEWGIVVYRFRVK